MEPTSPGLIRKWLEDCIQNHQLCTPQATSKLPIRVIDVLSRQDPFLVEPNDEYGDYFALSYCWGEKRRPDMMLFGLTSKGRRGFSDPVPNMETHKTRIPLCSMPKTLSDAVIVTRLMGVKYLWIDALCIVQGDDEEWANEHDNLVGIYTNAKLVIAADTADGLEKGFLHHRVSPVRYKDTGRSETTTCPSPLSLDEPLNHRAWSLSEVIFSTRVIHFTSTSIIWECNTVRHCTLGCSLNFEQGVDDDEISFRFFRHTDLAKRYTKTDLYRNWDTLVELFTRRQINSNTNENYKDAQRLIALSRLAKRFSFILKEVHGCTDEYLAGMWKQNLTTSLLWSIENGLDQYPDVTWRRPAVPRAPSWSWAAVEGPVFYDTFSGFHSKIRIEEATVTLFSESDQFDQVREGRLVVQGKALHELRVARVDCTGHVCDISGSGFGGVWKFICDVPLCDEDLRDEFCCLVVGEVKDSCWAMLLLRPVLGVSRHFRRVGISSQCVKISRVDALLDTLIEELVVVV
jgi:hypothetical protein